MQGKYPGNNGGHPRRPVSFTYKLILENGFTIYWKATSAGEAVKTYGIACPSSPPVIEVRSHGNRTITEGRWK